MPYVPFDWRVMRSPTVLIVDPEFEASVRRQLLDQAIRNLTVTSIGREIIQMLLWEPVDNFVAQEIRTEFARLSNSLLSSCEHSSRPSEKPSA